MNLEIYHDTPEDYIRNIRTCRIVVPRGRLVKAYTMKFKLPRGEFGRKVLMWKFNAFMWYVKFNEWSRK